MFERLNEQGDLHAANQSGAQFLKDEHSIRSSTLLPHYTAQINQAHEAVTCAGTNLQIPELLDELDGTLRRLPSQCGKTALTTEHYKWIPHAPALITRSADLSRSGTPMPEVRAVDLWTVRKLGGGAVKPFAILIYQRMSDYEAEPIRTAVAPLKFRMAIPGERDSKRFNLEKLFLEESALCHAFNERDLASPLKDKTTRELAHLANDLNFFSSRSAIPDAYWDGDVISGNLGIRQGKWDGNDTPHMRRFYKERIEDCRKDFLALKTKLKDLWIDPDLLTPGIYESKKKLPRINSLFHPATTIPRSWPWQKDTFIPGGIIAEVARDTEAHICAPLDTSIYRERLATQLESHIQSPNEGFMP